MRLWLASSIAMLAAAAVPRPAAADTVLDADTTVEVQFYVPRNNGDDGTAQSNDEDDFTEITDADSTVKERYLNQARCLCDRAAGDMAADGQYVLFKLKATPQPTEANASAPLDVVAGRQCDSMDLTATQRADTCSTIRQFTVDAINDNMPVPVFARVADLVSSGTPSGVPRTCTSSPQSESQLYLLSDAAGNAPFDEIEEDFKISYDITPPTMPNQLTAVGLENAVRISWEASTSERPDSYQALCVKADGSPAHTKLDGSAEPTHAADFDTTRSICDLAPDELNLATVDGGDTTLVAPDPLKRLDPAYVCGRNSGSATSIDLTGLENGVAYLVVVLAVDTAHNYHAMFVPKLVTPQPVTDFWEDANAENPDVNGGFCVAQVGRGGSAVSALLVLGAIGVAVRRRRRRRAGGAAALTTLAALVLAPSIARAQSYEPYWIDSESDSTEREEVPEWHLGLRVGPYHPAVDDKYMSDPGPFRRMFGPGYNLVPQLDLHRLWSLGAFQLGVGASVGYYRKAAEVFQANTDPSAPDRPRVSGAENTFQMVPLSATVLARLPLLDDRWGVPVVPYVRGGVAYNVWWLRTPTDELALACDTCKDKALGASAGLVGAVGIAIRGERIDPEASHSMRNGGVEHAGFYAEVETAWVDGFGNAKRMSLGDTTWYAGVDFEF